MEVRRGSRLARLVAVIAAGATLLGFGTPAAQAAVPMHTYDEATALAAAAATGTTYYVSTSGDTANDGTDQTKPTTLEKVNQTTFKPGDKILFKAGDTWEATGDAKLDYDNPTALLHPLGSGDATAKITLGSYGSVDGSRPILKGNAKVNDTVQLKDQEQWDISGLDVSNTAAGFTGNDDGGAIDEQNGALVGDLRGIHIYGQSAATLTGFNLHDLYVHDVTGEISWITQSAIAIPFDEGRANMEKQKNGVNMKGGWDFSKRTGGILMETFKPTGEPTIISDVLVENNDLRQNSFGAFTIKQWYGGSNAYAWWDGRAENNYQSKARMHKNVTVRNNYIDQKGVYNGDGIYVTTTQGSLIEGNVVGYPGVCGIELYFADSVTVQNNEVYESQRKAGGGDSNAIDPDRNCTNVVIQYNYIHDNGDGLLICGYDYNTVIIRYNVLFNNRAKIIRDSVGGGSIDVYNNVFYQGSDIQKPLHPGDTPTWISAGGNSNEIWSVKNNIFYYEANSTGNNLSNHTMSGGTYVQYDHNAYYGFTPTSSNDANGIVDASGASPFQGALKEHAYPTQLSERVSAFDVLKLADAQLNNAGVPYEWNAKLSPENTIFGLGDSMAKDYDGTAINAATPDPGILETEFAGVGGSVTDAYARTVAGVTVTFAGAKTYTATTGASGFYQIADIAPGSYKVTVADANGTTLATADATVNADYTTVNLTTTAKTGSIAGTVTDSANQPIAGAKVTLAITASKQLEATTDAKGVYAFNDVPVSLSDLRFTLTASKDGYANGTLRNVEVTADATTQAAAIVLGKSTNFEFDVDNATMSNDGLTKRYGETNNATYSGGQWTAFEHAKVGSWAEYTFDVAADGAYDLTVFTKDKSNRATAQMSIDGVNVGSPMVMSSSANDTRQSYPFGGVQLTAGKHTVRFTVTDTAKGNLFGLDNMTVTEHITVPDGLTTLSKEDFSQQTDPANYGFAQYATVADGKLTASGMGNFTAVETLLPIDVRAQSKAGIRFLWSGATSTNDNGNSKAGVQLRDEYGRLLFALTSAKGSEVRYSTEAKDAGKTGVDVSKAATEAVEPVWTTVNADPTKTYAVNVVADFAKGTVSFTVTPADGGAAIIDSSASTTASSLSKLVIANYWGTKTSQTLDDIELRGATPAADLDLPLKGKTVYAFGDSIVAGHKYSAASFATFAASAEGMSIQRYAKNGAAIAYVDSKTSAKDLWISYQVEHAPAAAPDVVLLDGGTNDAENIKNGVTTVDAYKTAFADTIKQIQAKWPTAKIVFTAVPKLYTRDYDIQAQLHEVQVQACKELGVVLADAYTAGGDGITEANKAQYSFANVSSVTGLPEAGTNTGSGTHPNFEGIRTFYLPVVRAALRADAPTPEPGPAQVDKSVLEAAVAAATKLNKADYTAESWAPFAKALTDAQSVLKDNAATQEAVDAAATALVKAQSALVAATPEPTADKTALDAIIDAAKQVQLDDYTAETADAFAKALAEAERVAADAQASQDDVDKAISGLADAWAALAVKPAPAPAVDKSVLEAAVAAATKLNEADYTAESWTPFAKALADAQSVLKDDAADQAAVNAAATALIAAQSALVAAAPEPGPNPGPNPEPNKPGNGNTTGDGNGNDASGDANGDAKADQPAGDAAQNDNAQQNAQQNTADAKPTELSHTGASVAAIAVIALLLAAAGLALAVRRRA